MEDDLMRIFGADRLKRLLKTFRIKEGERISHRFITSAIRTAQQKVEQFHFEARKNLLKFDDVMNDQRNVIFEQRRELMASSSVKQMIDDTRHELIQNVIYGFMPPKSEPDEWDLEGLKAELARLLALELPISEWVKEQKEPTADGLIEVVIKASDSWMEEKHKNINPELVRDMEKGLLLQTIDQMWKEHLQALDYLKRSIGLRAYGQRDPLNEYKKEAFILFESMLDKVHEQSTILLTHAQLKLTPVGQQAADGQTDDIDYSNVGRNDMCPCGSGKKFKHCHGKIA